MPVCFVSLIFPPNYLRLLVSASHRVLVYPYIREFVLLGKQLPRSMFYFKIIELSHSRTTLFNRIYNILIYAIRIKHLDTGFQFYNDNAFLSHIEYHKESGYEHLSYILYNSSFLLVE